LAELLMGNSAAVPPADCPAIKIAQTAEPLAALPAGPAFPQRIIRTAGEIGPGSDLFPWEEKLPL
jgi:hypothetical protein